MALELKLMQLFCVLPFDTPETYIDNSGCDVVIVSRRENGIGLSAVLSDQAV